jgi:hypothetical protein
VQTAERPQVPEHDRVNGNRANSQQGQLARAELFFRWTTFGVSNRFDPARRQQSVWRTGRQQLIQMYVSLKHGLRVGVFKASRIRRQGQLTCQAKPRLNRKASRVPAAKLPIYGLRNSLKASRQELAKIRINSKITDLWTKEFVESEQSKDPVVAIEPTHESSGCGRQE